ncbi:MAG TPA: energy-coupling factor transporter transmembrane protein EcfT [Spirochaetales bacterium]|nr:energy-coupling factor transporter transmembrane protein EcfT [Spirochaetales bacterium]HPS15264.1 energy-coupling factor transporter transmembrane protein EcfT [Spirochaetales bacterium]
MKSLEFFRNISIGQYVDSHSWFHRLRPAAKYIVLFSLTVLAIAAPSPVGAVLSICVAFVVALGSKIRLSFLLRSVKPVLPVIVLTALLQFLFAWPNDTSTVFLRAGIFSVTMYEVWLVIMILLKATAMIIIVGWFTSVTTESDIARGLEDLLRPLDNKYFPVHRLALAVSTSIRFVPIVAGELEEIVKAQSSRGADFGAGKKNVFALARGYLPLFVPVIVRSLERAEVLAEAMEARCYTGVGQTQPPKAPRQRGEIIFLLSFVALIALVLIGDSIYFSAWIRPF